jgi:hypothetical protein
MIFAIDEDGALLVFESEAEVRRELEAIDVVSDVYTFFDENGNALSATQDLLQVREGWRRFAFGPSTSYSLRHATDDSAEPDLIALKTEVRYLMKNPYFGTIAEVMNHVRSRRGAAG